MTYRVKGTVLAVGSAGLIALSLWSLLKPAGAHDSWISRGGYRGVGPAAGEWCCGDGDCAMLAQGAVRVRSDGFEIDGEGVIRFGDRTIVKRYRERVPESEAQPSPDGAFWRCERPDGSRRCFFAPPQGS